MGGARKESLITFACKTVLTMKSVYVVEAVDPTSSFRLESELGVVDVRFAICKKNTFSKEGKVDARREHLSEDATSCLC